MIQAFDLRTEYMKNPVGLDICIPRLSWTVLHAVRQTAYALQIRVNNENVQLLTADNTDTMHHDLKVELPSRAIVHWQVRLKDENSEWGDWSDWASFEMGLLSGEDWKSKWIMGDYEHSPDVKVRYPADYFRKQFDADGTIQKARLYISACGMYETSINGKREGNQVMAPGSTAFQRRAHYQIYDVTNYLKKNNRWDITLADGFYASKAGVFGKGKTYGHETKVLAQLEIAYSDGSMQTVGTDSTFSWSNDGPVRFADMKDGEIMDCRCVPTYSGKAKETYYDGVLCCSNNVPVREKERFENPKILHCPDGRTVLDFGQNIAGYVQVKVKGTAGHKCTMVFGEKLDENGNFTQQNLYAKPYTETHFQTIDLICNGETVTYKPKFTVMGFQYVLLVDWPEEIKPENFTAIAVYSDLRETYEFRCSDPLLEKIVQNTHWSVKGNFLDVPTDCPTRERAGWTGDAQLFATTAMFLYECYPFFRKWLRDVTDVQHKNGMVYNINPSMPGGSRLYEWISMEGSCGWGDALITIPYDVWQMTGDDRLIREFWPNMVRCLQFYLKRLGKRNLFSAFMLTPFGKYSKYISGTGRDFGEWTEPADCAPGNLSLLLPHPEEATAYIARSVNCMAKMAKHLGKSEAARQYTELFGKIKQAYSHYFLKPENLRSKRMARFVRPILCGVCDDAQKQHLIKNMVQLNRERNNRIGTGFLSTRAFFEIMTEAGFGDDAYKVLTNPEIGWAQQIANGATTIWENWTDDASLNHYSKGACCQWMFGCLCGIQMDGQENHFVIRPHVINSINSIATRYDSVYGTVESGWQHVQGGTQYHVTIPANCTADIILHGMRIITVDSGTYTYLLP